MRSLAARPPALLDLPNRLPQPVAWQSLHYGLDPNGFFISAQRRFGDVFTARVLRETWVVLGNPDDAAEVFALGPEQANSGEANYELRPLLGTRNVLLLDGPEHLSRRRLTLPPFHGDRMRAYEEVIRETTMGTIAALPRGRPVSLLPLAQSLTFGVIMRCVFGVGEQERLAELGSALRDMLRWITDVRRALTFAALGPQRLMGLPAFRRLVSEVDRALYAEIERRRRAPDLSERADILSLLLQARDDAGNGLSDGELRDELATLLVAGHETTATLIAWAAHELARDAESQERIAGGDADFLEAAITETLRLRPPVPLVVRRLREPWRIAGHELPPGTTLAPSMLLVHRRADLYPDPWRFDPARFLDRRPQRSEWFPFGGGVRRCLGAAFARFEARIVLEQLLDSVRLTPGRGRPERTGRRGVVLVPAHGARVVAVDADPKRRG